MISPAPSDRNAPTPELQPRKPTSPLPAHHALSISRFPNEDEWPLLAREDALSRCLDHLDPEAADAPSRLLHIVGESGIGKSFFVKELLCRFARCAPSSICLYIDIEESEFESANLEKRLAVLALHPTHSTRRDPQHIPDHGHLAKHLRVIPVWLRVLKSAYRGLKEAIGEIPVLGKPAQQMLPSEFPTTDRKDVFGPGRFWEHLITSSRRAPVLLALDNYQFLPESTAMELETVLSAAGAGFRLLVSERVIRGAQSVMAVRSFRNRRMAISLDPLSSQDTYDLARTVLGEDTPNLAGLSAVIYRKSQGNPKQIWLQLRAVRVNYSIDEHSVHGYSVQGYEDAIRSLPQPDRKVLQLVTLLMGGIRIDDLVWMLRRIVSPLSEADVRRTILDLTVIGLLIVNGSFHNRVRTEHELVRSSVRRTVSEEETLDLRQDAIGALSQRLELGASDAEYDRLVDRLVGLLSPADIRARHDLLAHLIALIDRQHAAEHFHYLTVLFSTDVCRESLDLLPTHCLMALLDAFQKTSQFDKGLAAVELMRVSQKLADRTLSLYAAKYLVQKFDYEGAEAQLQRMEAGTDRDVILFNILLNLRREPEARRLLALLPKKASELDRNQCVMLRNSSHLYNENQARILLTLARDGFRRHGSAFGEATTLNNLGVLELWAGNTGDARTHLVAAREGLAALSSNEVYQPCTNLAVLHAMESDLDMAQKYLDEAKGAVSPWLAMDDLMLRFNQIVLGLLAGTQRGSEAAGVVAELWRQSLATKDLRFQAVLAWCAFQLEEAFASTSQIRSPSDFNATVRDGEYSGLEVFVNADVDGERVSLVFVLSPHWRY